MDQVREEFNPDLSCAGILAGRVERKTLSYLRTEEKLKEHFGEVLYDTVIYKDVRVEESYNNRKPITVYDPKGRAAKQFRKLAKEFEKRLGGGRVNA